MQTAVEDNCSCSMESIITITTIAHTLAVIAVTVLIIAAIIAAIALMKCTQIDSILVLYANLIVFEVLPFLSSRLLANQFVLIVLYHHLQQAYSQIPFQSE